MQKRRGCLWLAVGIILALLAGSFAFVTMLQATAARLAPPEVLKTQVVVAVREIALRAVIQDADIEVKELPTDAVPEGAAVAAEEVVGKIAMVKFVPGEIILKSRLADLTKKGENIALTIPEGKVVIAIPATDLMSTLSILQPGDKVDILWSIEIKGKEQDSGGLLTMATLQNQEITAIVLPPVVTSPSGGAQPGSEKPVAVGPKALLFAVDPQDAVILKYLKDSGGTIDVVLRAPTDKRIYSTEPVHINYLDDLYQFTVPKPPF
jgi:pilus assembly protein CpaB